MTTLPAASYWLAYDGVVYVDAATTICPLLNAPLFTTTRLSAS
mgnify:CR=1 FL=1